ncbi:MAG: hypothetical protein RBG13Loki_1340 [Promethearchaeota archaeon CR_4]|nr:MAG: hypothetical protein RBG13Loki_1340 [Candidatus Lokiarchaeota archaeon CR_4]
MVFPRARKPVADPAAVPHGPTKVGTCRLFGTNGGATVPSIKIALSRKNLPLNQGPYEEFMMARKWANQEVDNNLVAQLGIHTLPLVFLKGGEKKGATPFFSKIYYAHEFTNPLD